MDKQNIEDMKVKKDVQGLLQALKAENRAMRRSAALALGEIGDPNAVQPLIEALRLSEQAFLSDIDFDFNMQFMDIIASALGKIGEHAVGPLILSLKDVDTSKALIKVGIPAVESLIKLLEDKNRAVRQRASYALGEIMDKRAVEPLIHSLIDDDDKVRGSVAFALGEFGDSRAVEPLTQALKDTNVDVRMNAADALGVIGDSKAVKQLILILKRDEEWVVRQSAARALGEIGDPKAVKQLSKTKKKDKDEFVRKAAEEALEEINSKKAENDM